MVTLEQLHKMFPGAPSANNQSLLEALEIYGPRAGLDDDVCLAHFLAQIGHESGGLVYNKEIWGPTKAQRGYEGRKDLGNVKAGDGSKFRGYGLIQLTGRANVTAFYNWCKAKGLKPPNFLDNPKLIATAPWSGLSAIWYWDVGNPAKKSINRYAKDNNIIMVTKAINGGLNGFDDRLERYGRVALVLLGYPTTKQGIIDFQVKHMGARRGSRDADGIIGDKTRMALHQALDGTNPFAITTTVKQTTVVNEKELVPVIPPDLEEPWYKTAGGVKEIASAGGITTAVGVITDVSFEKLALIFGVVALSGLAWYIIRRQRKNQVKATAAEITATPNVVTTTTTED